MEVPDVIAQIEEGGQGGVETSSQFFGLLLGRHFIGDEDALKVNSDAPMFMACAIV